MNTSKDLLLAILSMDAYNQGYGDRIEHGETQIGSALVTLQSGVQMDSAEVAAGFYAISYTIGAGVDGLDEGSSVISYRGTDDFLTEFPLTDFPIIIGDYDEPSLSYSTQFFKSVEAAADPESKLILTGHSLGGWHGELRLAA